MRSLGTGRATGALWPGHPVMTPGVLVGAFTALSPVPRSASPAPMRIRKGAAAASCVAIPLALADVSQACCKRKVGQGGSGEPPPSHGSVATSGWSVSDSRRHVVCEHVGHHSRFIPLLLTELTRLFSGWSAQLS
ncbi:hypothetical protein EDB92DRAFT_1824096 [Lactarius akahatsu]|uniref:Uncharacterized protein n=1 Tax=Lactarius akahatsu TaxID=416441 RepID=A0AAD4L3V4_9AGAM|nr:hypothetical protein EDB92DRAFT_1824096 [Lactarius akahatsu]